MNLSRFPLIAVFSRYPVPKLCKISLPVWISGVSIQLLFSLEHVKNFWRSEMLIPMQFVLFVSCYLCDFVLLCAHAICTDVLYFNPYNHFFLKVVLLFSWSVWLCFLLSLASNNLELEALNAQGIRDFQERKAIFMWIKKQNANSVFLQETVPLKVKLHWSVRDEVKCFLPLALITAEVLSFYSVIILRSTLKVYWRIMTAVVSFWKYSFKTLSFLS